MNTNTASPTAKRSFAFISPSRYQHPLDREMLASLKSTPGLEDIVRFYRKHWYEKEERILCTGSCVRVGEKQFGQLYRRFHECCDCLGVHPIPSLYLEERAQINAWTNGTEEPYITITSGAIERSSPAELECLIGHELGHIRLGHVLYYSIAQEMCGVAVRMAQAIPIIGQAVALLGQPLITALQAAFSRWQRASEYSADRAGLLASQDLTAALTFEMKCAGVPPCLYSQMNVEAFLEQAEEFEGLKADWISSYLQSRMEIAMDHPWSVLRAAELKRWHDSGEYATLVGEAIHTGPSVAATGTILPAPPLPFRCSVCNETVPATDRFCSQCGSPCRESDRFRRCSSCGAECAPNLPTCSACGSHLSNVLTQGGGS